MSDFKADFQKHHDNAGKAFKGGDHKGAASSLGHALRSLKRSSGPPEPVTVADNPAPVGDDGIMVQRGFGPGLQFGKGSGTGTPKPSPLHGKQKPSLRGILSGMKGMGGAKK